MSVNQQERDYYTQIHEAAQARIKHMLTTIGELEEQCGHLEEHRILGAFGEYRDALFVVSIDLMRIKESLTYLSRLEHQMSNRMFIKPTED
jgi:hypothetical protein